MVTQLLPCCKCTFLDGHKQRQLFSRACILQYSELMYVNAKCPSSDISNTSAFLLTQLIYVDAYDLIHLNISNDRHYLFSPAAPTNISRDRHTLVEQLMSDLKSLRYESPHPPSNVSVGGDPCCNTSSPDSGQRRSAIFVTHRMAQCFFR